MNEEHIQFGAKEIRKIGMTAEEKKRVLEQVLKTPLPAKPVRSPWLRHTFASFSKKHTFAFYTAACTLVLVLGGTSLVYASSGSLPGNALYPLKTDVVEPLRSALTFSLEAKAEYESHLATERLIEAETLASDNKLDASKEAELNLLLENHADALNKALGKIRAEKKAASRGDDAGKNSNDGDEEIVTNFKAEMNAMPACSTSSGATARMRMTRAALTMRRRFQTPPATMQRTCAAAGRAAMQARAMHIQSIRTLFNLLSIRR
ncbi:MAG: DUF5667 domain-containing protein [bacterium]